MTILILLCSLCLVAASVTFAFILGRDSERRSHDEVLRSLYARHREEDGLWQDKCLELVRRAEQAENVARVIGARRPMVMDRRWN